MKAIKTLLLIGVVAFLGALPFTGGKIFDAVTSRLPEKETPKELKDLNGTPAKEWKEEAPKAETADSQKARELYLAGMKYFQAGNYEKASEEWQAAAKLDPANEDVKTGLKRVEFMKKN